MTQTLVLHDRLFICHKHQMQRAEKIGAMSQRGKVSVMLILFTEVCGINGAQSTMDYPLWGGYIGAFKTQSDEM